MIKISILFFCLVVLTISSTLEPIVFQSETIATLDEINKKVYIMGLAGNIISSKNISGTDADNLRNNWNAQPIINLGWDIKLRPSNATQINSTTMRGRDIIAKDSGSGLTVYRGAYCKLPVQNATHISQNINQPVVIYSKEDIELSSKIEDTAIIQGKNIRMKPGFSGFRRDIKLLSY